MLKDWGDVCLDWLDRCYCYIVNTPTTRTLDEVKQLSIPAQTLKNELNNLICKMAVLSRHYLFDMLPSIHILFSLIIILNFALQKIIYLLTKYHMQIFLGRCRFK